MSTCDTNADRPSPCTLYPNLSSLVKDIPALFRAVMMCSMLVRGKDQENLTVHLKRTLFNKGQHVYA